MNSGFNRGGMDTALFLANRSRPKDANELKAIHAEIARTGQMRLRSLLVSLGSVPFLLSYLDISKNLLWNYPVNG